jgi:hypothetical protein
VCRPCPGAPPVMCTPPKPPPAVPTPLLPVSCLIACTSATWHILIGRSTAWHPHHMQALRRSSTELAWHTYNIYAARRLFGVQVMPWRPASHAATNTAAAGMGHATAAAIVATHCSRCSLGVQAMPWRPASHVHRAGGPPKPPPTPLLLVSYRMMPHRALQLSSTGMTRHTCHSTQRGAYSVCRPCPGAPPIMPPPTPLLPA